MARLPKPVRLFALILCLTLVASLVAACGGGDDDEGSTPTAESAAPTATQPAAAEPTATAPAATATEEPAPTEPSPTEPAADEATPTESSAPATEPAGSPTAEALTDEEQALMAVLLSPNDLPDEWNELRREVPEDDEDDPGFCGSGEFPRADEQLAQVEVEMQSGDNAAFVLQNLTEFEEDVAEDAMEFARNSFSCGEFTDDDGTVFTVEPTDAPEVGDDAFAIKVAFQVADAGELQGDFVFVRVGGMVSILTVLEFENYDPERTAQFAEIAADKMTGAAGTAVGLEPAQETLIEALITQDDLPQGWNVLSAASPTDPEGWTGMCNTGVNPAAADAVARVSVDFYEGLGDSDATVQQVITAYPSGGGDDAMDYERESMTCGEWTAGSTTITLEPVEYEADASVDDLVAITFTYEDEAAGSVSGNWIVIQVGDLVSNLIYTDPEGVDSDLAQELIDAAVERMNAG